MNKPPEHDEDGEDPDNRRKREVENTGYRDFNEVFRYILGLLRKKRVIHEDPDAVMDLAISNGASYALGSVGLQDLFTVRTVRRAWPVIEADQEVAELALDESIYRFKRVLRDNTERQCRMEAELRASAPDELLRDIIDRLRGRFGPGGDGTQARPRGRHQEGRLVGPESRRPGDPQGRAR